MYEYYNIGRFLYFRFDEKNWIPKKALHHYNREWAHLAIAIHQGPEAKRIFFRVRDNTMSSFMTGLREVINLWLYTYSGVRYQDQYMHRRQTQRAQVAAALGALGALSAGNLAPNLPPICIKKTKFPRGPGIVPDRPARSANANNNAANDNPVDQTPVDQTPVNNRFLPFFLAFVTRPKCVRHVWRYNLQFVSDDILGTWNKDHVEGDPAVPLFQGLTTVVCKMAPKMLIHVLENRRQQWAVSGLPNAFARTSACTMSHPDVPMEAFAPAGMGGVRANIFPELAVDEDEDRVIGEPRGLDGAPDPEWDGALCW
jgi:hypothetical protein